MEEDIFKSFTGYTSSVDEEKGKYISRIYYVCSSKKDKLIEEIEVPSIEAGKSYNNNKLKQLLNS